MNYPALKDGASMAERAHSVIANWLTTAPHPRAPRTGFDAGQRGWRTHAVIADPGVSFADARDLRAICGLRPAHGWGMDLFIEQKCARCLRALKRMADGSTPRRKPTRRDLLIIIGRLQNIVGSIPGAAGDRNDNRARDLAVIAQDGLDLCIEALSHDPPIDPTGPWAKP